MANWLEELLTKMDSKVDRIDERLNVIDVTLAKHEANLQEHIRRTALAEENLDLLRAETKVGFKEQAEDIKPLQKHVHKIEGALKLVGLIATIVGLSAGVVSVFSWITRLP